MSWNGLRGSPRCRSNVRFIGLTASQDQLRDPNGPDCPSNYLGYGTRRVDRPSLPVTILRHTPCRISPAPTEPKASFSGDPSAITSASTIPSASSAPSSRSRPRRRLLPPCHCQTDRRYGRCAGRPEAIAWVVTQTTLRTNSRGTVGIQFRKHHSHHRERASPITPGVLCR